MAIHVLRGRPKVAESEPDELAIGEIDREIFNCPICSRPLARGAARCPGCRTRLVMGVPMRRVSLFVALGTTGAVAIALTAITFLSVLQAFASRGTTAGPDPTAVSATQRPGATGLPRSVVPVVVRSSLDQAAGINQRLAGAGAQLRAALGRRDLDSIAVAGLLRDLAADATHGADLIGRLRTWSDADVVASDLEAFYRDIRAVARAGLAASHTNDGAYRSAAQRMIAVLRRTGGVNLGIREFAETYAIDLPSMPGSASPQPSVTEAGSTSAQPA